MASYTLEDVERIRNRSGISYEEAINLLDAHNGDAARVLADLEKRGRLKENDAARTAGKTNERNNGGSKIMNLIQKLYRTRIKVTKGNTTIVNLSVLFMALAVLIFSPHLAILSLILGLVLGYRITIDKDDEAFREEKVEALVKNAADNVKQAVSGISREINNAVEKKKAETREAPAAKQPEIRTEAKAEPRREIRVEAEDGEVIAEPKLDMNDGIVEELENREKGPDVPTIQVPVGAENTDSGVEVYNEGNGYHSVSVG